MNNEISIGKESKLLILMLDIGDKLTIMSPVGNSNFSWQPA